MGRLKLIRFLSLLLISIITTAYTPNPEPDDKGFINVFGNKQKRADRHFNNSEYKSAIRLYKKLVKKGKADDLAKLRLAESYFKVNDPLNAEKWYEEVIHTNLITPEHKIQYAQALLSNGNYSKARQVVESYEFATSDYRSKAIIDTLGRLEISSPSGEATYVSSDQEADNLYKFDITAPEPEVISADNSFNPDPIILDSTMEPQGISGLSTLAGSELEEGNISTIHAAVIDENKKTLQDVKLKLLVNGQEYETVFSNDDGKISIQVPADQEYILITTKDGFEERVITLPAESLGQEEDLLIVMNSTIVDSELPRNQFLITERKPLEVSGQELKTELEGGDRPHIQGVALKKEPEYSLEAAEELSTTELDPLAVSDDPWGESELASLAVSDEDRAHEAEASGLDPLLRPVAVKVIDAGNGESLIAAGLKIFVDSPNETVNYEINEGVLKFEALSEEDYIVVASHNDYQDHFIKLSGAELLQESKEEISLELTKRDQVSYHKGKDGPLTKFKAQVRDEETNELLEDAEVMFFVDGRAVESEYSKENGKTLFKSPRGDDYMMLVSRKGYQDLIYHLPGAPEEDMDIDLAMLKAEDPSHLSPYQQLVFRPQVFDEVTGTDLDNITFKVFENGDPVEVTSDLSSLEIDPEKQYQLVTSKDGYQERLVSLDSDQLKNLEPIDLMISMQPERISETTGFEAYQGSSDGGIIPITASIVNITDDEPIAEAVVLVFADDRIQDRTTTWNSGTVTINAIRGKDYKLLVKREGYSDKILNMGIISRAIDGLEIAMIPTDIQNIRQSGVDLSQANMLVMSSPSGSDQLYLSTGEDLYQYHVDNDNHYLINGDQRIILKKRTRTLNNKVATKQDYDQFNLTPEGQFLDDQLSADEKEMVQKIVDQLLDQGSLEETPELAIYYNNLPPEYRKLVNDMAASPLEFPEQSDIPSKIKLDQLLTENNISLTSTFDINAIYYDFDKSEIREDAATELDKLLLILKSNKNIKVMMFSHTDSRGSSDYNNKLSKIRGEAAVNYLVEQGIAKDRFTVNARGESQLVNSCGNSVKCSEKAHQLNRRTEFMLSA